MNLDDFFPYRLARLSESVSQAVAQVYKSRFELSRDEWRIVAALAGNERMRNVDLVSHSSLDKMQVSRAVARLADAALVTKLKDPEDGRGFVLRLTPAGRSLYRKIVPMVLAREAFLLEGLDAQERASLARAMDKLQARARTLQQQG